MKLCTGISEIKPEWKLVLQQIGVPVQHINISKKIFPDQCAVLIISSGDAVNYRENILRFLHTGGSLLLDADTARQLLEIKVKSIYIKYLYPTDTSLVPFSTPVDLHKRCSIALSAQYAKNQKGIQTIAEKTVGKGRALILPSGCIHSILDYAVQRKNFPTEFGERYPSERVSRVSKAGIRNLIKSCLTYLYHARHLPFLHLWHFPHGAKSQFTFRVDTDFSTQQQVEKLYKVCRRYNIPGTWFVEVKSQADWIRYYRDMENQEIGYHCYGHRIFPDAARNREDFEQGMAVMEKVGLRPKGYAAPYGEWNPAVAQIAREYGFQYSSEFGLACDDVPFYPFLGDSFSRVLQIPIHPISTGSLRRARHHKKDMMDYYLKVLKIKKTAYEPIIFYHHPVHGYFEVFDTVFQEVKKQNIPVVSLGSFAEWWKRRTDFIWDPELVKEKLDLHASGSDSSVWIKISLPTGEGFLNPATKKTQLLIGERSLEEKPDSFNYDTKKLRKYNWRMCIHDLEHYRGKLKR